MKSLLLVLSGMVATAAMAAPSVTIKSVSQDPDSRAVKVCYSLADGPAVVTASDVTVDGVSIGAEHFRTTWGDINRKVSQPAEGDLTFWWSVDRDWPDHDVEAGKLAVALKAWPQGDGPDWLLVNLHCEGDNKYFENEAQLPFGPSTQEVYKTERLLLKMVRPKGVEWLMGSPEGEFGRDAESSRLSEEYGNANLVGKETLHRVRLTKNYYLGVYFLTMGQYENVMATGYGSQETWGSEAGSVLNVCRPGWWGPEYVGWITTYKMRPIEYVSYNTLTTPTDALPQLSFFKNLENFSGLSFTLPTEAEWEFACRAGTTSGLYTGRECVEPAGSCAHVGAIARYKRNGGCDQYGNERGRNKYYDANNVSPWAGRQTPNDWGFYDFCGGVWEMCRDAYVRDLGSAPAVDPVTTSGSAVAVRGGAYNEEAGFCRSASRAGLAKDAAYRAAGFRVCLEL